MKTTIVKHEGNKIEVVEGNDVKEYELEEWVKPSFVGLGEAEITVSNGKVSFVSMKKAEKPVEKKGQTSAPVKTGNWEDDIVNFETLLTKAHNMKDPFSIKTEMLQLDVEKKYALFKAQVIIDGGMGGVFEAHGDATSENVTGEFIKPHFIRLAETRAIVRALRWYTNNGCAEEEK